MTRTLLTNGVIHGNPGATAVAIENDRIVFVGTDDQADAFESADETLDLYGALVAPAFVDAHTHSVLTGFQLTRLDLRHTDTLTEALDKVAELAEHTPEGVVIGTGWEEHSWPEGRPPTGDELERAAPGRMVLLERRDCHSSVISGPLADAVPGLTELDGYSSNGRVERDARQAVSEALGELVGPEQRLVAATASAAAMAANGIAGFHEAAAPHIGPAYELELVRHAAARVGILPTVYWGKRDAFEEAHELGAAGLAGDLNCDGAIGSRTAALHVDYDDQPGNHGHAFLNPEQIADHLQACTEAGLQGGFHCIGEAALENLASGLELLRDRIGPDRIRAARHRFEHVEMPSDRLMRLMGELGVAASMQPMFDDLWGGPDQMYADRLGERWHGMNPVGRMHRYGVRMAFGSDTPVTQIGPWSAVRAAVWHKDDSERVSPSVAFEAHTAGGWWAARIDDAGHLKPRQKAHLAVWDCPVGLADDLPVLDEGAPLPWLRHLFVDGNLISEER